MFLLTVLSSWASVRGDVLISELLASSSGDSDALRDEDGDAVDWIEIHNDGPRAVDLGDWRLTDDEADLRKWRFPAGVVIGPGEYLLVFASGKNRRTAGRPLHTNFSLRRGGEFLALVQRDGLVAHRLAPEYPPQRRDVSYGPRGGRRGRQPHYFIRPTPGAPNAGGLPGFVADTRFSPDRGFFTEPFELAITTTTPGARVYFTTDGSDPTSGNPRARLLEPDDTISIERTSTVRAAAYKDGWRATNIDTHTYLFLADILKQSADGRPPPGWPDEPINRQVFDYGMDPDVVNDPEWGRLMEAAMTSIPSISLVTDLHHLFDPLTGLYVHARGTGKQWERPTSVELLHFDGTEGFQVDAGLRPRGNFSASGRNPKHAFRLFFRSEYGDAKLRYPLFGDEGVDEFDKIDLRTAQNDSWAYQHSEELTFVHDVYARDLQRDMGHPYTRSRYYHLYLNGQYWGLYQSQERAEASYGASYFGGRREEYDTIKSSGGPRYTTEATDGDLRAWRRLWEAVRSGVQDDADYFALQGRNPDGSRNEELEVLLDVDNLIDYMIGIFYTGDEDRGLSRPFRNNRPNNFFALRRRGGDRGFVFFAQDAEQSFFSNHNVEGLHANRVGPFMGSNWNNFSYSNPQWIHQDLMANDEYRLRFADRVHRYFFNGGLLTPETVTRNFLRRAAEIELAIIGESARWGDAQRRRPFTRDHWQRALDRLVERFIPVRLGIVMDQLLTAKRATPAGLVDAPLYPSVAAPVFSRHGGRIEPGFELTLKADDGTIYYTLDGTDPRRVGGDVAAGASVFERGEPIRLARTTRVLARALVGGEWSALTEAVFVGDTSCLRVTEIMYHPPPPRVGSPFSSETFSSEDYEFIELQNVGERPLNLTGVRFSKGVRFTFPGRDGPRQRDLGPDETVLVVRNARAFTQRYPGAGLYIAGEFEGQLSNRADNLVLEDGAGTALLRCRYVDSWYPLTDGRGSSLEMVDPTEGTASWSDRSAWRSSPGPLGTPGEVPGSPDERFRRGDPDGSGRVDVADVIVILNVLFNGASTPSCLEAADTDNDGAVDLSDPVRLLDFLFGGAPLAPPVVECGTDPNAPRLPCDYRTC